MNKEVQQAWRDKAKGIVKSEMTLRNMGYAELAERLKLLGIDENPPNLSNKICRGAFGADFMLQVLTAIGCERVHLK